MLVITRKPERGRAGRVRIEHAGEYLDVSVAEMRPGRVVLAFDGPQSFAVIRHELILDHLGKPLPESQRGLDKVGDHGI